MTPSCIAEMKRGGSAVIRSTARARRFPSCSNSMIRVRRDVTSPYSAATKNAFRSSRPTRASNSSRKVMRRSPARAYWAAVRRPRESVERVYRGFRRYERMFYTRLMRVEYREEPCKTALNRVKGMPFDWSLNPYMGCVHRCTFCYVRAFELRADRPSDDRYGSSIRVKTNIAEVLRRQLARASWAGEPIAIGAATDPYQPAEGRYRLTRGCLQVLRDASQAFSIITRGPLIVRDAELLAEASRRADVSVTFSVPTLDTEVWRTTEPGTSPPAQRLRALGVLVEHGVRASVGMAPLLPGLSDRPDQIRRVVEAARAAGACGIWANLLYLKPGTKEHFMDAWPATGRSSSPTTSSSTTAARISRRPTPSRPAPRSAGWRERTGFATGARSRCGRRRGPSSCPSCPPRRMRAHGRRDHGVDRRRPRGRTRRTAAFPLQGAAHSRHRRSGRRRLGGHARGPSQTRCRDHGRADARHGRARGDEAPHRSRFPTRRS